MDVNGMFHIIVLMYPFFQACVAKKFQTKQIFRLLYVCILKLNSLTMMIATTTMMMMESKAFTHDTIKIASNLLLFYAYIRVFVFVLTSANCKIN